MRTEITNAVQLLLAVALKAARQGMNHDAKKFTIIVKHANVRNKRFVIEPYIETFSYSHCIQAILRMLFIGVGEDPLRKRNALQQIFECFVWLKEFFVIKEVMYIFMPIIVVNLVARCLCNQTRDASEVGAIG